MSIKKLAGDTVIYGVGSIAGRLLNWVILTPYLTNGALSPAEYGVQSYFYSLAGVLMVFFTYRMETAFFRFGNEPENRPLSYSTAVISLIFSTGAIVGFLRLFAQPISSVLGYSGHPEYLSWFALILGFDTLAAIPFAHLRLANRPIKFTVLRLLNIFINIFFVLFFLSWCPTLQHEYPFIKAIYDENNRVNYVFIANAIASFVVLICLIPEYFKIKFTFDKNLWRQMLRYALPLVIVGLAGMINELADRIMLKYLLVWFGKVATPTEADAENGIYSACYKLAIFMTLFIQAFNYAAEPFFFKNAKRDDSKVLYGRVTQAFMLVGCTAFVLIMLYLEVIKYFHFIGEAFWVGLPVVPVLLLANLFLGLYYNFSTWYKISDNTNIGAKIAMIGAVITIVANLVLVPMFSYIGSAWATLLCYFYMAVATYWQGKKHYPINYPIKRMTIYLFSALGVYFLSEMIKPFLGGQLLSIIAVNTILLGFYCAQIYYLERKSLFLTPKKNI